MANTKVILTRTIQYRNEKGESVTLKPSDEPQGIPADLAKEGLDRGWAKKPDTKRRAAAADDGGDDAGDGTGGGSDGDES